jgi:uncharacterized protein YndB with AHSA1/START domain
VIPFDKGVSGTERECAMDLVTGTEVAVAVVVPLPREHVWNLVTAVERIGEWSPETTGGRWCDEPGVPVAGARFLGTNRFPDGTETTAICVVVAAVEPELFAWDVLDADGATGSAWRYELADGLSPGTTIIRHSFRHGPGLTGARDAGTMNGRLGSLCRNMLTTITAMTTGATR